MRRGYRGAGLTVDGGVDTHRVHRIDNATVNTRLRGREHPMRFIRDAAQHVGVVPTRAMCMCKPPEARCELTIERGRPALRACECMNARHVLWIEADADDRTRRIDRMLAIRGHDDDRTARIACNDIRIERDEQRDTVLRVMARERPRRRTNTDLLVEVDTDPGIVQAPRRHSP